jgi:hypothetical protein
MSLCMYKCASLASERLNGFHSYSAFKGFSITGWCPVNMDILAPNTEPLHRSLQNRTSQFSRKHLQRFWFSFSKLWRLISLNRTAVVSSGTCRYPFSRPKHESGEVISPVTIIWECMCNIFAPAFISHYLSSPPTYFFIQDAVFQRM